METQAYHNMASEQESHWWFMARREIISSVIASIGLTKKSKIIEIGCGTGGNLQMLEKYGQVEASEKNDFSRAYAQKTTGIKVREGSLPDNIDNLEGEFDLICLLDVLEHIDQDLQALLAVKKLLKKNGSLLITVPAYKWLYSAHDKSHHHFRRYSKQDIVEKSIRAKLIVERIGHFNCLLFPLLIMLRITDKISSSHKSRGNNTPSPIINIILYNIFRMEKSILKYTNLPFGSSLVAILKKEPEAHSR